MTRTFNRCHCHLCCSFQNWLL